MVFLILLVRLRQTSCHTFLTYTRNREDLHNHALVKSTLKLPNRYNVIVPIRIKGHNLQAQVEYFISKQHTKNGLDPHIHILDGIYNIKGKSVLYVMVANYTNKHTSFNKGQCIGHMELQIDRNSQTPVNSITTQKMMDDQVQPDTSTPPLHHLFWEVKWSLDELFDSFKSQFLKDETSIGMTNLAKMQIDTGTSDPVSQKPYPIAMKHYDWVRDEIDKLLDVKMIHSSHSSWSAPITVVPKGDGGNAMSLIIETWTKSLEVLSGPCQRLRTSSPSWMVHNYSSTLGLKAGYHHIPLNDA